MSTKMLIDASHPEETRVAVLKGNRVDEFDFESENKKPLRGNIYLAKVTRVEPSLQAAFVEYGGNRHGFLAFSEIHPDYYQIPVADRQALLREEAEAARESDEAEDEPAPRRRRSRKADVESEADEVQAKTRKRRSRRGGRRRSGADDETDTSEQTTEEGSNDDVPDASGSDDASDAAQDEQPSAEAAASDDDAQEGDANEKDESVDSSDDVDEGQSDESDDGGPSRTMAAENEGESVSEPAEAASGEDAEEKPKPRRRRRKKADEPEAAEAASEADGAEAASEEAEEKPKPKRRRRKKADDADTEAKAEIEAAPEAAPEADADAQAEVEASEETPKPKRRRRRKADEQPAEEKPSVETTAEATSEPSTEETSDKDKSEEEKKPRRRRSSRAKAKKDDAPEESVEEVEAAASDDDDSEPIDDDVEQVGVDDALEEVPTRRISRRNYKIQEVIKRRQIMLVQVVKEERGNKGAALTTYLSLAGRYSVLMPNTARGGGISRKITSAGDRKKLKEIASSLDVADGMGVILRTAGAARSKTEITRDFEYLLRLWENVRQLTLKSTAPCLVYEEGSLIKRSIRDLYGTETKEILVSGRNGYEEARDFMEMLEPSQKKSVKLYDEPAPLFARMGVEAQLDNMLQPQVTLKSGGYLVINQTEALVAIDVNSGKSTRQHSIEETAYQTNLEAAEEVARQLRLRDLAGLIVIDFIDMDDRRNNRAVEKRLKEALKNDRARIQVGRISHFGLLEMSRQRMRASVLESATETCSTCSGLGYVRSNSSVSIHVLRSIEEQLIRSAKNNLTVRTRLSTAMYLLNHKRSTLDDLENRFGVTITIEPDETVGQNHLAIERGDVARPRNRPDAHVQVDSIQPDDREDEAEAPDPEPETALAEAENDDQPRRRRRGRRGSRPKDEQDTSSDEAAEAKDVSGDEGAGEVEKDDDESEKASARSQAPVEEEKPKRRRRRRKKDDEETVETKADAADEPVEAESGTDEASLETDGDEPLRRTRRSTSRPRRRKAEPSEAVAATAIEPNSKAQPTAETGELIGEAAEQVEADTASEASGGSASDDPKASEPPAPPRRRTSRVRKRKADTTEAEASPPSEVSEETSNENGVDEAEVDEGSQQATMQAAADAAESEDGKDKKGWWQRTFFS